MKSVTATLAATALLAIAGSAHALTDLVDNGDFTSTTSGTYGQVGYNVTLADWTVLGTPETSYTFLFAPGKAATTGATGYDGNVTLWGPPHNTFTGYGPSGAGPVLAQDSDFQVEPIEQTIKNLTIGDRYTVTFDWAGAQQNVEKGATNDQYAVTLSSTGVAGTCSNGTFATTRCTSVVDVKARGFSGWQTATMTFVATSRTEILSFLAKGTISGEPSFALLDDVAMYQTGTPEPATWALMFLGVAGVGGAMRRRRRTLAASA
jgi:hypothetical protein